MRSISTSGRPPAEGCLHDVQESSRDSSEVRAQLLADAFPAADPGSEPTAVLFV